MEIPSVMRIETQVPKNKVFKTRSGTKNVFYPIFNLYKLNNNTPAVLEV
jgi:hypothetical protein